MWLLFSSMMCCCTPIAPPLQSCSSRCTASCLCEVWWWRRLRAAWVPQTALQSMVEIGWSCWLDIFKFPTAYTHENLWNVQIFFKLIIFFRALMVAANGEEEKTKWLEDLTTAINQAKTRPDNAFHYLSLKSISKIMKR